MSPVSGTRQGGWSMNLKQRGGRSISAARQTKLATLLTKYGLKGSELEKLLEARIQRPRVYIARATTHYKFAVVSDTHLVDKACALSELHHFYQKCKNEGVTEIVHAGDLLAGQGVYPGQLNDLLCFGADAHLNYAYENYPFVPEIKTYCISGNHDFDYHKSGGINILEHLSQRRADIIYLGIYDATVVLNGIKIGLHHGAGGPAYAESYKIQKYIEKVGGGQKPQIYVLGHYHGSFYMFYRNIHALLPGCWQKPNDFSVRHGFPNMIGGWIIDLSVANDRHSTITDISTKFVAFYT